MENKYNKLMLTYGYMAIIMVLKDLIDAENYAECALIEQAFLYHEERFGLTLPREICDEVLEDYKCAFWRLGYSGEVATNNLDVYYKAVKQELRL